MSSTTTLHLTLAMGTTFAPRWQHCNVAYPVIQGPGATLLNAANGKPVPPADVIPVDYTGCTARLQFRREVLADDVLMEFTTQPASDQGAITLGADGWVSLALSAAQTALLPYGTGSGQWTNAVGQMEVTFADGTVQRPFELHLCLSPEGTR